MDLDQRLQRLLERCTTGHSLCALCFPCVREVIRTDATDEVLSAALRRVAPEVYPHIERRHDFLSDRRRWCSRCKVDPRGRDKRFSVGGVKWTRAPRPRRVKRRGPRLAERAREMGERLALSPAVGEVAITTGQIEWGRFHIEQLREGAQRHGWADAFPTWMLSLPPDARPVLLDLLDAVLPAAPESESESGDDE